MTTKLKLFSNNTKKLKRSSSNLRQIKKKSSLANWKILEAKMLIIKLNKKLSLRKKCKFSKNAWKT